LHWVCLPTTASSQDIKLILVSQRACRVHRTRQQAEWQAERRFGSKAAQKLMFALSPVYPELRTLASAVGMSQLCHKRSCLFRAMAPLM